MIYQPLAPFTNIKNAIFLAGACPRKAGDGDWRDEMIAELEQCGFKGDIINPTNPNYDTNDKDYYDKQCTWETLGLHIASTIVFWIDRNDKHPALTTNIEFGIWSGKAPQALIVGVPEGSEHCEYIKWVCGKKGIPCYSTMTDVATAVVNKYARIPKLFFTSDTHFGSDRHLELSQRPFKNVEEMDLTLVSNWNKTVFGNDIVFHLGDFGELDYLDILNFGSMVYLKGNYERDDPNFAVSNPNVLVKDSVGEILRFKDMCCVHEPLTEVSEEKAFYLFGHIHEKGLVKRNGLNVGVDAHNYTPINEETVLFYKNAIENHYDENVFCDKVNPKND